MKKFAYTLILCLGAIAIINLAGIYSHTSFSTPTNLPESSIENPSISSIKKFPLGWIDHIKKPETPAQVVNEGIDLLIPYTARNNPEAILTYLEAAQKNGIKVFLEPYRKSVEAIDVTEVAEFVRTYKRHPALAGWYAYDEPAVKNKVSPENLQIIYQAIKTEDQQHPVAVVFASSQIRKVPQYWNAMDICMIDRYPLFYSKPEFNNLGDFGKWMQKASYYAGEKTFWPVLQGFGEQKNGKPKFRRRLPTAAEERYMFYTAVLAGADGLIFYGHHWTQQSWVNSVLTPLIAEFRQYLPIIDAKLIAKNPLVNRADIRTVLYKKPSSQQYLLIAVHHGKGKVKATFDLESANLTNISNIDVLGENRQIKMKQNYAIDSFTSYDVHIYELS